MNAHRSRRHITGTVQGLGFRPFVYNLAQSLNLCGFVANDTRGVTVEVEGGHKNITQFLASLETSHPPQALIEKISVKNIIPSGEKTFRIHESKTGRVRSLFSPADIAT